MTTLLSLLIEDERRNQKLMFDVLSMRFEVLVATCGEQGLDLISQRQPSIVFLDLELPDMDGLDLLVRLKRSPTTSQVPVVVVSAHAMPETIEQAMRCGCDEYVTKPIIEDFFQFVERMGDRASNWTASAPPERFLQVGTRLLLIFVLVLVLVGRI